MKLNTKHDADALNYRVVKYKEWLEVYGGDSGEFNTAVMNQGKTEVMLTYRYNSLGNLTRKQAQDYISKNWVGEAEE